MLPTGNGIVAIPLDVANASTAHAAEVPVTGAAGE